MRYGSPSIAQGLRQLQAAGINAFLVAKQLVRDKDPQVRREVAIALRQSKSSDAAEVWAELALQHDGKDRWYLEALGNSADAARAAKL